LSSEIIRFITIPTFFTADVGPTLIGETEQIIFPDNMIQGNPRGPRSQWSVRGQLPPEDVSESGENATWVQLDIPGRRRPIRQYSHGEDETFSFRAFFI